MGMQQPTSQASGHGDHAPAPAPVVGDHALHFGGALQLAESRPRKLEAPNSRTVCAMSSNSFGTAGALRSGRCASASAKASSRGDSIRPGPRCRFGHAGRFGRQGAGPQPGEPARRRGSAKAQAHSRPREAALQHQQQVRHRQQVAGDAPHCVVLARSTSAWVRTGQAGSAPWAALQQVRPPPRRHRRRLAIGQWRTDSPPRRARGCGGVGLGGIDHPPPYQCRC